MRPNNTHPRKQACIEQEDPRLRSKCTTPKKDISFNQGTREDRIQQQEQRTHPKKPRYLHRSSSPTKSIQQQWRYKLQGYQVVARTLEQYFRSRQCKDSRRQLLCTIVNMIKAYARSQIRQTSPSVQLLIHRILDTIPIPTNPQQAIQALVDSPQISIAREPINRKYIINTETQKLLQMQIESLEQRLQQLRSRAHESRLAHEQVRSMTEQEREEYVRELESTIEAQRRVLEELDNQY